MAATHAVRAGANDAAGRAAAAEGAARNGWNIAEGYHLEVFAPPEGGMYPGLTRAAEVRVGRPVPLYFFGALGMQPVDCTARATGPGFDNGPQCITPLDQNAHRAATSTASNSRM